MRWTGAFPPSVTTREKGHGRIETRTIQVLHVHDGLAFPYAEQAARIERITERPKSVIDPHTHCRVCQPTTTREVAYVITSLYPEQAGPEQLLAINRGHWSIEAMHHIQDVTYDEDRSRIRTRHGPANMTTLTRLAVAIIRHLGFRTVPDGQRLLANDRDDLIRRLVALGCQPLCGELPGIPMPPSGRPAPTPHRYPSITASNFLTAPAVLSKRTPPPQHLSEHAGTLRRPWKANAHKQEAEG